jgi:hypothetical protein
VSSSATNKKFYEIDTCSTGSVVVGGTVVVVVVVDFVVVILSLESGWTS